MNYYMADTPGRLRIESPALKAGSPDAEKFLDYIKRIPGVSSVETKRVIGSATIHYDTKVLDHKKLIQALDGSGYFEDSKAKTPDDYLEEGIEKVVGAAVDAAEDEL